MTTSTPTPQPMTALSPLAVQHFIITRSAYQSSAHDIDYIRTREQLFIDINLKSLSSQTRKRFTHVRIVSHDHPWKPPTVPYGYHLIQTPADLSLPSVPDHHSEPFPTRWWNTCVAPYLNPDTTHVVTTRVDDDDALNINYSALLFNKINCQPANSAILATPHAIIFPRGCITDRITCDDLNHPHNQFCSLITPVERKLTVFCHYKHNEILSAYPSLYIHASAMWLWVRHPLAKSATPYRPSSHARPYRDITRLFGLSEETPDV